MFIYVYIYIYIYIVWFLELNLSVSTLSGVIQAYYTYLKVATPTRPRRVATLMRHVVPAHHHRRVIFIYARSPAPGTAPVRAPQSIASYVGSLRQP